MDYRKLAYPLVGVALLGSVATSALTIANADSTTTGASSSSTKGAWGNHAHMTPPAAAGKVTAISGSAITISDKRSGTTYTVDASAATVTKDNASASVSNIAVGDMISVEGTVSGTTVTATAIHDGFGGHPGGRGMGGPGGAMGTVSAINGSTLTVTDKNGGTYTVDASSATVKASGSASSLSSVKIGDTVMIRGQITTASMTAKTIEDGLPTPPAQSKANASSGTSTQ